MPYLRSVSIGVWLRVGSMMELPAENGLSHYLEHMVFKGTTKRSNRQIAEEIDAVGGQLNAFTGKDCTCLYAKVIDENIDLAIDVLSDLVLNATLDPADFDKERGVILEEIGCYEDNPAELIFDDFEEILFRGHALGHNILGTPRHVRRLNPTHARSFADRYYHPANAVLFVYGNIPFSRIVLWTERFTADLPSGCPNRNRTAPPPYTPCKVEQTRRTHQTHVMLGCVGYPSGDKRRTGLYLLNNMLGGPGMNSRLNLALREHSGLVYSVESNLTSYTDTGVFNIYFGTDARDADRCIELTLKELDRLRHQPLTTLQLSAAKKQLIGQVGVASDNFESTALGMAKTYLHYGKYEGLEALYRRIEALTAKELWDIANELFGQDNLSVLIYR